MGMPEYIYTMQRVRKAHGDKVILDDVTLSFLPGAKIGVVGPNGTGKSTLLRMMAGLEQVSNGDARLMPGFTVGMLQQEPPLNEDKTVLGNVEEGVAETKAMLDRFNEIAEKMAVDYSDALLDEMGRVANPGGEECVDDGAHEDRERRDVEGIGRRAMGEHVPQTRVDGIMIAIQRGGQQPCGRLRRGGQPGDEEKNAEAGEKETRHGRGGGGIGGGEAGKEGV